MSPPVDLSTITSYTSAFEANVATLAVFLARHRIASCAVEYRGSGDSGESEEQTFEPLEGDDISEAASNEKLAFVAFTPSFNETPSKAEIKDCDLESFLSRTLDHALIANNHSGYENGEGGGGTLTIHATGAWELAHFDYVVSEEHDTSDGSVAERVAELIAAQKVIEAERSNATLTILPAIPPTPFTVCI